MKRIILSMLFISCVGSVYCQESPDSVFWDLVKTYRSVDGLSCDIQYKYADEKNPDKYLDSLNGKYINKGIDAWFEIDETINIRNSDYTIAIFQEDKIIYVGKSKDGRSIRDPLGAIDSLVRYDPSIHSKVKSVKDTWELTLDLPKDASCKRITYVIDKKSGLLLKTVAVVKKSLMYDQGSAPPDGNDEFSNIETIYSNYKIGNIDASIFNTASYFSGQSDDLKPSKKYELYKVVKATPK